MFPLLIYVGQLIIEDFYLFLFLGIWFLKSYVRKGMVGCFWNFKLNIDLYSQVLAYQCNNAFLVHFCFLGMTIILLLLFYFISQQLFAIECNVNCNDNHNTRCGCWHLTILSKFNYHSLTIKCEHTKTQCKSWTFILIIGLIEFIILIFFQLWTLDICVYNKIYYYFFLGKMIIFKGLLNSIIGLFKWVKRKIKT